VKTLRLTFVPETADFHTDAGPGNDEAPG
jgi:hypothetical protein